MAKIEFIDVSKSFGSNNVISHLNLTIQDGTFTVLVGPSGCGKTTLLRMIAGIGPATSGKILLDEQDISDLPPGKRQIAMVFQNYAIYPSMSVRENIEFGLKNNHVPKEERKLLINEVSESVGLTDFLDRKPATLSGGQRQRVALARAMVKKPKVFLMDEPLSNLDAKLRVAMRTELIRLHKQLNTTFVYVTHDQTEAMSMADHIVLMDHGIIQQEATPATIYRDPDNVFSAQFIGTPPMNIFSLKGTKIKYGFRPERASLAKQATSKGFFRKCKIATRELLGSEIQYCIELKEGLVMVKSMNDDFQLDEEVYIQVDDQWIYFFDENDKRIRDTNKIEDYLMHLKTAEQI
ncbi:ABC transporter ATP-binding protein [Treponema parvum]|uniref:ABC transporter ATP-binding protein n=1 Tax=Treponema parvum TaxID=138851 RepID=A0A975F3I0_9SPIR|nr:ABC transporter ATP-binding protein [Treponema parvum]QTQ13673.1 ABC transporter ATP-binding protein [Treponema parvum]